jgi:hypothetical protein
MEFHFSWETIYHLGIQFVMYLFKETIFKKSRYVCQYFPMFRFLTKYFRQVVIKCWGKGLTIQIVGSSYEKILNKFYEGNVDHV